MAGVNDITIIGGILALLILVGAFLPFVQEDFGATVTENDVEGIQGDASDATPVGAFQILVSVLDVVFWGFGSLPLWLNLIFLLLRIMVLLIIARNVWIGGGG